MHLAEAQPAGKGRADPGALEIDPRRLDRRSVGGERRLVLVLGAGRRLQGVDRGVAGLAQHEIALAVGLGVFQRRRIALGLRLSLVERRLVAAGVDLVEQFARLDVGAVGHRALDEIAGDLRLQRHDANRLGGADVIEIDRHGPLHHRHHRHFGGPRERPSAGRRSCRDARRAAAGSSRAGRARGRRQRRCRIRAALMAPPLTAQSPGAA